METASFSDFPDRANIWIYAADRILSDEETSRMLSQLKSFLADWTSHGRSVTAAADVLYTRFLVIVGYLPQDSVSGCGIDASVQAADEVGREFDIQWEPSLRVFHQDSSGRVVSTSRSEFEQLVESGTITLDTPVYDVSLEQLKDLRSEGLKRPARKSWHARAFPFPTSVE